jgi:N-ethylmaleimide reductase
MTDPFINLIAGAVQTPDGRSFAQLVHPGRLSNPALPHRRAPVAPSAVRAAGWAGTPDGPAEFVMPRALETEEVTAIVSGYSRSARLALSAGFDGVEIHAGGGFLPHQFLAADTNMRIDKWGGSIPNRIRFLLEAAEAAAVVIGADRVAVRISPGYGLNGVEERDAEVVYAFLAHRLSALGLAWLHVLDCRPGFDLAGLIGANYIGRWRIDPGSLAVPEAPAAFARAA